MQKLKNQILAKNSRLLVEILSSEEELVVVFQPELGAIEWFFARFLETWLFSKRNAEL